MNEQEIQKRFGPFADYYRDFLNMPEDEFRIIVAKLASDLPQAISDVRKQSTREMATHIDDFTHKKTRLSLGLGLTEMSM